LFLTANLRDAWRDAPLDVVLEAWPAPLSGDDFVARADSEQPVRQPHRASRKLCRQEWPCIEIAVTLDMPRHRAFVETLRSWSTEDMDNSCRREEGCCISAMRA
jgi:hypothetical protein